MRGKWLCGALLLSLAGTMPASAQWQYSFTGTFRMNHEQEENQTLTFTLTAASPITTAQWLTPTSCSITPSVLGGNSYGCADQEFDPAGFGTGYNFIGASYISYDQFTGDPNGGGGGFFFFDPWAFTTVGTHYVTSDPLFVPNPDYDPELVCEDGEWVDACNEFNWYGSAGQGVLIVSNLDGGTPGEVVPEPASMLLVATGLAGMAAARRRSPRS